jgi:WD40 repeat protein
LKERVQYLEQRCKVLTVENESLKAEVEMYRTDAASLRPLVGAAAEEVTTTDSQQPLTKEEDDFIKCGNGVYAKTTEVVLDKLHDISNILCCSLSNDDSMLATGGADQHLVACLWNKAFGSETSEKVVQTASRINCNAPVIAIDFARYGRTPKFLAAGCMDGTVHVVFVDKSYDGDADLVLEEVATGTIKHSKYVRVVAWSSTENILATASADGSVQVHKLEWNLIDTTGVKLEKVQTLQLPGPVEAMCFHKDHLICYARGSPYLMYFDLQDNYTQFKINLNQGPGNAGFDDHVSMCIMDMKPYGDYLALATDTSRNIIIHWKTGKQIRNLYGHQNDSYSQPKIAWSNNGQYLYGNTQEETAICVWDIASSSIVDRLQGHTNVIRDMFSSTLTDTLVTTSFDKKTQFWLAPAE